MVNITLNKHSLQEIVYSDNENTILRRFTWRNVEYMSYVYEYTLIVNKQLPLDIKFSVAGFKLVKVRGDIASKTHITVESAFDIPEAIKLLNYILVFYG